MPYIAICPHCLSDNWVSMDRTHLLVRFGQPSIPYDQAHLYVHCLDCGQVVYGKQLIVVKVYPTDAAFELTAAGRAALQELQA